MPRALVDLRHEVCHLFQQLRLCVAAYGPSVVSAIGVCCGICSLLHLHNDLLSFAVTFCPSYHLHTCLSTPFASVLTRDCHPLPCLYHVSLPRHVLDSPLSTSLHTARTLMALLGRPPAANLAAGNTWRAAPSWSAEAWRCFCLVLAVCRLLVCWKPCTGGRIACILGFCYCAMLVQCFAA